MTIHHDLALLLAVLLVVACIVGPHCSGDTMKDLIHFAGSIVIATFAHAQGARSGAAAAKKQEQHEDRSDGQR